MLNIFYAGKNPLGLMSIKHIEKMTEELTGVSKCTLQRIKWTEGDWKLVTVGEKRKRDVPISKQRDAFLKTAIRLKVHSLFDRNTNIKKSLF